jgi:membrane dipeptidase
MSDMRIVDLHCDTLTGGWQNPDWKLRENEGHIDLMKLKDGQSLCQLFAVWISRRAMETTNPYDYYRALVDLYHREMDANTDLILKARSWKEIMDNKAAGKMSGMLSIEDGVCFEGKIERVEEAYRDDVRMVGLLWNYENEIGYPCRDDREEHLRGLKPFGFEVIEEMNRLGMIIDVSHLSEGGFYDVAKYSKQPFMATHSCARALTNHKRNLTDDQLRTLAEKGGVAGINFECSFLKEGSSRATYEQIIQHLLHMKNVAGIETIGFGSDFDGIDDNGELVNYGGFSTLLQMMEKHFTYDEMDKITHLNALRVMKDVLGK